MKCAAQRNLSIRPLSRLSILHSIPILRLSDTCCIAANDLQRPEPWLQRYCKTQVRGAKSKATLNINDLPQGILAGGKSIPDEVSSGPSYPTVVQQVRNNMQKFEKCVILTRVGGFYELYFEHAEEYGPLLNLKVAQKKTSVGPVPMAGFPFFQLDRFLKTLVQDLNKNVAISEEFPNNVSGKVKSGGLLFDRKVTRVVTPGTLVDERFMDPYENNFLLAIHPTGESNAIDSSCGAPEELAASTLFSKLASISVGLAWLDLSTGELFTQSATVATLPSAVARINAKEIVFRSGTEKHLQDVILGSLEHQRHLITWKDGAPRLQAISDWTPMLEAAIPKKEEEAFTTEEVLAGTMLLDYAKEQLQGLSMKLQPPVRRKEEENLAIDKSSMKGLEILETSRDGLGGGKGSLIHAVRRTVTKGGARLLKDRLSSPSTSLNTINVRLDLVEHFLDHPELRDHVTSLLRRTYDSQRLVQKFSLGRGDADDLVSLLRTIESTKKIVGVLQESLKADPHLSLKALLGRLSLDGPDALAAHISNAIDEDQLLATHHVEEIASSEMMAMAKTILDSEGSPADAEAMSQIARVKPAPNSPKDADNEAEDTWIMRKTASQTLEKLHGDLADSSHEKAALAASLRKGSDAMSLSLRWTPGLGHICHVKGVKDVRISFEAFPSSRNVSSTKSTRSFYLPDWSTLGGKIDQIKLHIRSEEQRIFQSLREKVILNLVKLRRNASVLDEIDLATSLANLAAENHLVRPVLDLGTSHKVVGGRHPTVKMGLEEQGRAFVSNDCFVGEKERILLITGPNMAGKSTFLRQNALLSILAQLGSFVPAEHAEIGIVDRIFSRVGSADNLFQGQSTFMVEMLETAAILKQATKRSFVIMDEVGRGTTPEDGIAVAFACLHHLYHVNRCRTLFATHFHDLADMTSSWEQLSCCCTDIAEQPDGSFSYVHRLRKGVNRQSHALKVARLAGIPEAAIATAKNILSTPRRLFSHDFN